MRDKILTRVLPILLIFGIGILPLFFTTGCDETGPTGPTSSDTCDIAYVILDPPSVTVTIDDDRVVFTAEAYDSEDRLLDPAPTFHFTTDSREITITPSGNKVYAAPWTVTSEPAVITVTVRDCEGREYTDTSTMIVDDSPTMRLLKRIIDFFG